MGVINGRNKKDRPPMAGKPNKKKVFKTKKSIKTIQILKQLQ